MTPLLIDSNYLCCVSFYSMPDLSHEEQKVSVIFGFLKQILFLSRHFNTNNFIFCFDSRNSYRKLIYPEYKMNRNKKKDEVETEYYYLLYDQVREIQRNTLRMLGFSNIFQVSGYESDDLFAYLVMNKIKDNAFIVTSDQDIYQLLSYANMYIPKNKKIYTEITFNKEFGIIPNDWKMVKAIAGCSSDNIKGIEGVGEKTAIKYLKGELKKESKKYKDIEQGKDIIKRNLKLVSLPYKNKDFKLKIKENECNNDRFKAMFCYYGFRSLLKESMFGLE